MRILDVEDMIEFHKGTADIVKCYQQCDAFCLPSFYEGYPNAICEAMSCGRPILCGNICDNPLIVSNGYNGFLFNPYDVKDIVDKIKKIVGCIANDLHIIAENNRKDALQKFSEDSFVKKYIKLLEE